jgi:hypothetical protein
MVEKKFYNPSAVLLLSCLRTLVRLVILIIKATNSIVVPIIFLAVSKNGHPTMTFYTLQLFEF